MGKSSSTKGKGPCPEPLGSGRWWSSRLELSSSNSRHCAKNLATFFLQRGCHRDEEGSGECESLDMRMDRKKDDAMTTAWVATTKETTLALGFRDVCHCEFTRYLQGKANNKGSRTIQFLQNLFRSDARDEANDEPIRPHGEEMALVSQFVKTGTKPSPKRFALLETDNRARETLFFPA